MAGIAQRSWTLLNSNSYILNGGMSANHLVSIPRGCLKNQCSSKASYATSSQSWVSGSFTRLKERLCQMPINILHATGFQTEAAAMNRISRRNMNWYKKFYSFQHKFDFWKSFSRLLWRIKSRRLWFTTGLVGCAFDWNSTCVTVKDLKLHTDQITACHKFIQDTLTCKTCGKRLVIEKKVDGVDYCDCKDAPKSVYGVSTEGTDWKPFLERKDIIVWRKDHPTMKGMYVYKMYGKFNDVTAEEFLAVQLDLSEFRLSWDTSTSQCFVLDSDERSRQEVYYWEVTWPRFFSNRDYCCVRQTYTDPTTGISVLTSKSAHHPQCPQKSKCVRVEDYNSVLVVKPFKTPNDMGIEFSLTGFENPGVQLPESIITWVAIRGMPEFMTNLRAACILLRGHRESNLQQAQQVSGTSGGHGTSVNSSSTSSCATEANSTFSGGHRPGGGSVFA